MNRIIILLLALALFGCSKSLDIQLEPQVQMFVSDKSQKTLNFTEQDQAYQLLNKWLAEHKTNWFATSGRYPGGVYIKSGVHGIQVTKTKVIIYSTEGNEPKALYAQELKSGELTSLLNFTK